MAFVGLMIRTTQLQSVAGKISCQLTGKIEGRLLWQKKV
ncbi:hypothetical protein Q648_00431 [Bartonella quintana JK 12]|uniref:Uncharacterized protein n=2 Tax=Bartonella quintana TaxID=803 RepID=W3TX26_BARQI|nr:hypothetical protein Q651_00073 [Bartonella quintana BQ2-D70]ETS14214.1 hypothetical protein Q650_00844 [Bartonella quintana JK 73rel]ETS15901.1 hypothetical protein Q649_00853 [Bartonella quintana JK 73]ETS17904.1 hypothetical protein Q647_00842 [Bartonella quintana JK 7]ETS18733.1 hypothetical protein Q648_00431 [Bartonella quintana JK 12]KEC59870.1 hypothetical protein O93_00416 [Bartonella quintana JK 19]KEC62808.1 hypothetical protein O7Y_00845 [Bartonella quintana JK 63]KEC63334.1 h